MQRKRPLETADERLMKCRTDMAVLLLGCAIDQYVPTAQLQEVMAITGKPDRMAGRPVRALPCGSQLRLELTTIPPTISPNATA